MYLATRSPLSLPRWEQAPRSRRRKNTLDNNEEVEDDRRRREDDARDIDERERQQLHFRFNPKQEQNPKIQK